jgi:hypothetical protein
MIRIVTAKTLAALRAEVGHDTAEDRHCIGAGGRVQVRDHEEVN